MKTNARIISTLALASLSLTMSGCGEFSYKRGAGPTDFQAQKENCASQYDADKNIDACLAENGWLVVSADKPLIEDAATLSSPAEQQDADASAHTKKLDPLDKLDIGSWWKMGASPNQLMADGERCVATLGDDHQPQKNMSLVTRGFVICMKEMGWYAIAK